MKKASLTLFFMLMTISMSAQSIELKKEFQNVKSIFLEYNWKTPTNHMDNSNFTKTIIHNVMFIHPNLIIKLTDKYISSGWTINVDENSLGTKTIKIPINSLIKADDYRLTFKNEDGIEVTLNNKKSLKTDYFFTSDKIVIKNLASQLNSFFDLLNKESFTGSLGIQNSSISKIATKKGSQENKVQTNGNASKSGKYVQ